MSKTEHAFSIRLLILSQMHMESRLGLCFNLKRILPNEALEVKQIASLFSFKAFLNHGKRKVPKYYAIGKRKLQILHTRLRTNCSSLSSDLFFKNMTDSPAVVL